MYENVLTSVKKKARPLEAARAEYLLTGNAGDVVSILKNYQNEDGGFGHGLEPDFEMPFSSPVATWSAFGTMREIGYEHCAVTAERAAVFLKNVFDEGEMRWYAADVRVNDHPHTPWWHHDEKSGRCPIDASKGNPSAALTAYLYDVPDAAGLDPERISDSLVDYFIEKKDYSSEHETYCFIDLWERLSGNKKRRLGKAISEAVSQLVTYDPSEWADYRPSPLKFVRSPKGPFWGVDENGLRRELQLIRHILEKGELIKPNWPGEVYEDGYRGRALSAWEGILTVNALSVMKKFSGF